jgi:hypothetical protein
MAHGTMTRMSIASKHGFTRSADVLRRKLLAEELRSSQHQPRPRGEPCSEALQVLLEGFLHGSLLTLAVCTPKRGSRLSRASAKGETWRTFIVNGPAARPNVEEPAGVPVLACPRNHFRGHMLYFKSGSATRYCARTGRFSNTRTHS